MSSLTTNPVLIAPDSSRGLQRFLFASHILAIVPTVQSGLTSGQKFFIIALLLGSYCWQRYRIQYRRFGCCYRQGQWAVFRLKTGSAGRLPQSRVISENGVLEKLEYKYHLADQVVVTRWFILLYFYLPGCRWRKRSILIAADAVSPKIYRHLCVLLKWNP